ncbi:MAG TPA: HAD family hydrolase [Burkholderiaceae bacterium]|nr:HAD family hydrolase [Burkholderiaceae bacterium]
MRAIFLDKDGTLVEDVPYNVNPERVVLCPHAVDGLRLLQQQGYALIVISNQAGVAKGYFSETDLLQLQRHLTLLLQEHDIALSGLYYCPHSPDGSIAPYARHCRCRKPMPGMIIKAAREHDIETARSWMIGDILDDVEAGHRAGCKAVLIDNGNETEWKHGQFRTPDLVVRDLHAAAAAIVAADAAGTVMAQEAIRQ